MRVTPRYAGVCARALHGSAAETIEVAGTLSRRRSTDMYRMRMTQTGNARLRLVGDIAADCRYKRARVSCRAAAFCGAIAPASPKTASTEKTMIYELRIYSCIPGRLPALLKRFEGTTLEIW